jgi:hypothetical protein
MRFENFIDKNTSEFYDILSYLENYATDKIANIITNGWIQLRESISADDQDVIISKINEYFNTDIKNIYYLQGKLNILPIDWKNKVGDSYKIWEEIKDVISVNPTLLAYGLVWSEFIMRSE